MGTAYDLGETVPLEDSDYFSVGATLVINEEGVFIASSVYQINKHDEYETVVCVKNVETGEGYCKTFILDPYNITDNRSSDFEKLLVTYLREDAPYEDLFKED